MPAHAAASLAARHALLDRMASDASGWTRSDRVAALGDLQSLRGWLDAREAALLNAAYLANDDVNSGARDLIQFVQNQANVSFGVAKARACRSRWLPELRAAAKALETGALGTAHADELCVLAERLGPEHRPALFAAEAVLVSELAELTPVRARKHLQAFETELSEDDGRARFEKQQRDNSLRLFNKADGTTGITGQLDPLSAAYLSTALDRKVTELWRNHDTTPNDTDPPAEVMTNERRRAQALVALICDNHTNKTRNSGGHAELLVLIDYQTLLADLNTAGICTLANGAPLPADIARRLACDASIIPVVLGGPSAPLDVGRASRTATTAQKAALRAVHDTCCVDNCDVAFEHCQIHHIHWWRHGGRTDLNNLGPLCTKHHHLVHDHGWQLQFDNHRTATLHKHPQPKPLPGPTSPRPPREPPDRNRHHSPNPEPFPHTDPAIDTDHSPKPQDAPTPMRC